MPSSIATVGYNFFNKWLFLVCFLLNLWFYHVKLWLSPSDASFFPFTSESPRDTCRFCGVATFFPRSGAFLQHSLSKPPSLDSLVARAPIRQVSEPTLHIISPFRVRPSPFGDKLQLILSVSQWHSGATALSPILQNSHLILDSFGLLSRLHCF